MNRRSFFLTAFAPLLKPKSLPKSQAAAKAGLAHLHKGERVVMLKLNGEQFSNDIKRLIEEIKIAKERCGVSAENMAKLRFAAERAVVIE